MAHPILASEGLFHGIQDDLTSCSELKENKFLTSTWRGQPLAMPRCLLLSQGSEVKIIFSLMVRELWNAVWGFLSQKEDLLLPGASCLLEGVNYMHTFSAN